MSGGSQAFVDQKLKQWPVCIFSKKTTPECLRAKQILSQYEQYMPFRMCEYVEIESRHDSGAIENYLLRLSLNDSRIVPQIYLRGKYFGSLFELEHKHQENEFKKILESL